MASNRPPVRSDRDSLPWRRTLDMVSTWDALLRGHEDPLGGPIVPEVKADTEPWDWLDSLMRQVPGDLLTVRLRVTPDSVGVVGVTHFGDPLGALADVYDGFTGGYNRALSGSPEASSIEAKARRLLDAAGPPGPGDARRNLSEVERLNGPLARLLGAWFVATHPAPRALKRLRGPGSVGDVEKRIRRQQKRGDDLVRSLAAGVFLLRERGETVDSLGDILDVARVAHDLDLTRSTLGRRLDDSTLMRLGEGRRQGSDVAHRATVAVGLSRPSDPARPTHLAELADAVAAVAWRLRWTGHLPSSVAAEVGGVLPFPMEGEPVGRTFEAIADAFKSALVDVQAGRDVRRPTPLSQALGKSDVVRGLPTRNPEGAAVAVAVAVACGALSYRGVARFIKENKTVLEAALGGPLPTTDPTVRTLVRGLAGARVHMNGVFRGWVDRYPLGPESDEKEWPSLCRPGGGMAYFRVGSGPGQMGATDGYALRDVTDLAELVDGGPTGALPAGYRTLACVILHLVKRAHRVGGPNGVEGALALFGESSAGGGA